MFLRSLSPLLFLTTFSPAVGEEANEFGNRLATLPEDLSRLLAERNLPDESGAMSRNRSGYFHVRFQLGIHHLANFAIVSKEPRALEHFVNAMEYSFDHQRDGGEFDLVVPGDLTDQGVPSTADKASGVAFFASSAGSGWLALETCDWIQHTETLKPHLDRLGALKPKIRSTVDYLVVNRETLLKADGHAPNRLLFDAIALHTFGTLSGNEEAIAIAREFALVAAAQVHADGYFVEGGGYDSSYNGVATALALRLVLMGYLEELENVSKRAIAWQIGRIGKTGEISTEGNTRVNPDGGESFLGRQKDVDVGHTIEALMLASVCFGDESHARLAERVRDFYSRR